jgi:hypothetical protein
MLRRLHAAVLVSSACSAPPAPVPALPAPLAAPAPAALVVPAASLAEDAAAQTPPPAALPESTPAPPPVAPDAQVLIEPPYSALGHARLATEMATLERDDELFRWALGGSSDPTHPINRPGYHPATRVVVDVALLSRAPKGSTKRLERIARSSGYWPLRACFENAQRLSTKTERSARVRLTLSASGKVLASRSLGPTTEREYAQCVRERVRSLDFAPGFTRKLDVEISVKQWPGHAPVPPRAPDDAPKWKWPSESAAALEASSPALVACYAAGLARDPKLWGRLALRIELGAGGAVQQAVPVETHFPSDELVECARQALLGARLATPALSRFTLAIRFGQGAAPPAPPAGAPASAPELSAPPEPSPPAPLPPPDMSSQ